MSEKKRILMLSDSPTTSTGYATITRNILNLLSKDYECHCIGHNYFGQILKPPIIFEDDTNINFFLHGAGKAKYSMDIITDSIRKYKIDYFMILLDTFMTYESGFMGIDTSPAKTIFYYPSDGGGGLPIGCDKILKKIHYPVAMSKFGQKQVKEMYGIDSDYIPHGVDVKVFHPVKSKDDVKKDMIVQLSSGISVKGALYGKFVVGTVARNQGRKMLDRTIKSFSLFCRDKPDAVLLLHCDPTDAASPINLNDLIRLYNLENRVFYTGVTFFKSFTYSEMNKVYNVMDLFILTTSGEGFGIPIIEAMACGVTQIATDYTTSREIIIDDIQTGEVANLVGESFESTPSVHCGEILNGTLTGSWNVERGMVDLKHMSFLMDKLYKDKNLRNLYSKNSIVKVKKYYDWEVIKPQWENLIKRML